MAKHHAMKASYKQIIGYYLLVLLCSCPSLCSASMPTLAGKIDLEAPMIKLRVTPDGKRAVALMQPFGSQPQGIRIIDTSFSQKPVTKGFLAIVGGRIALAPSGQHVLILNLLEKEKHNTATKHDVSLIDLSDPYHPKKKWSREILARKVVLADDASAFAASLPPIKKPEKGQWEKWQTVITKIGNNRKMMVIEDPLHTDGTMHLSENATFLLFPMHGNYYNLYDLRSKRPILYEQDYTFLHRNQCLLGFLKDGHMIVKDARASRLGIYAPRKGIPRIAILPYDGDCERLNFKEYGTDSILVASTLKGRIDRINIRPLNKIWLDGSWQLPASTYAVAATQSNLFTVRNHRTLEIYSLDTSVITAFDWPTLEAVHHTIVEQYNKDISRKEPIPYFNAVSRFEDAGIQRALDAPVEGISTKKAAAIFNDYGFLASKSYDSSPSAEYALRRAITLDPERTLARLNLADMLRERLSDVTDFTTRQAKLSEIEALYRKYIELGGKSNAQIDNFLKGDPGKDTKGDICRTIANYTYAGRLRELISSVGLNIKAGNRRIDLVFGTEGTAHVPVIYAFDSITDFPLEDVVKTPGDETELWGGDELGLVVYRDSAHIIHYRDYRHPVATTSLSNGKACKFRTRTAQRIGPKAVEPDLCKTLMKRKGPPSIVFKIPAPVSRETVSKRYSETGAGKMRLLDFANSDLPANVAEMWLSSGAGPGCDAIFYDILDKLGKNLLTGPMHELLMKLQNVDPSDRYPMRPCGNKPRFFTHGGKIYFENKPATWPPIDESDQYHRVTRIDGSNVVDVCDFKFETTTSPVR